MSRPYCFLTVVAIATAGIPATAQTECYGEGDYRVCTTTTTDADGNIEIRSTDSMGNSYSVGSSSYATPSGRSVVESSDSMGNTYRVESWSDATGVHSVDSMGNRCTITNSGETIGC